MDESRAQSSVAAEDWLPVLEQLLDGLTHALSNRIAALSGIGQLIELSLATREESGQSISNETEQLRSFVELARPLGAVRATRREPALVGDSLRPAAQLLAHHRDLRGVRYEIPAADPTVEPLLLWRRDHLRMGVLFLMAAAGDLTGEADVRVSVEGVDGKVRLTALTPAAAGKVTEGAGFRALARFAEREGGQCTSAAAPGGTTALVLDLPGLARASALHET